MRIKLFEWVNKTFSDLSTNGLITYNEQICEKAAPQGKELFLITEISLSIGLKGMPKGCEQPVVHEAWKQELKNLLEIGQSDRLTFEADISSRNVTPNKTDISEGADPDGLIQKHSFLLRISVFKKRLVEEVKQ